MKILISEMNSFVSVLYLVFNIIYKLNYKITTLVFISQKLLIVYFIFF